MRCSRIVFACFSKPYLTCLRSGETCSEIASFSLSAFTVHSLPTMAVQALGLLVVPVTGEGTVWWAWFACRHVQWVLNLHQCMITWNLSGSEICIWQNEPFPQISFIWIICLQKCVPATADSLGAVETFISNLPAHTPNVLVFAYLKVFHFLYFVAISFTCIYVHSSPQTSFSSKINAPLCVKLITVDYKSCCHQLLSSLCI